MYGVNRVQNYDQTQSKLIYALLQGYELLNPLEPTSYQ